MSENCWISEFVVLRFVEMKCEGAGYKLNIQGEAAASSSSGQGL